MERPPLVPSPEEQQQLRELGAEVNRHLGITGPPTLTAEQLRARMISKGLNPLDRVFNRELMRTRYADDEDEK